MYMYVTTWMQNRFRYSLTLIMFTASIGLLSVLNVSSLINCRSNSASACLRPAEICVHCKFIAKNLIVNLQK